jgi:hypothetical protein
MGRIIATEHISLDGVVEAPGPGDIGDHPHKGWVFDFEPGETGERYKLDEARCWSRSGPGSRPSCAATS